MMVFGGFDLVGIKHLRCNSTTAGGPADGTFPICYKARVYMPWVATLYIAFPANFTKQGFLPDCQLGHKVSHPYSAPVFLPWISPGYESLSVKFSMLTPW